MIYRFIIKNQLQIHICLLCFIGLLQIFGVEKSLFAKQLVTTSIGIFAFLLARSSFFKKKLRLFIIPLYILSIVGLWLVLYSDPINGARRWFVLYGFSIQPSELAKIATIMMLALYFVFLRKYSRSRLFEYVISFAIFTIPAFFVFLQPDFGSAFLIGLTGLFFTLLNISPRKSELILLFITIFIVSILAFSNLREFQKRRIMSYVTSLRGETTNDNFNSIQAKVAVGSGGTMGKGLGAGTQSKLSFLPEDHTDFALSSFAEQFGFVGVSILVLIYIIMVVEMVLARNDSYFPLIRCILPGVIIMFGLQIFINLGMNLGILPVVGIPLPFISYGGSSLILWLFSLGLF